MQCLKRGKVDKKIINIGLSTITNYLFIRYISEVLDRAAGAIPVTRGWNIYFFREINIAKKIVQFLRVINFTKNILPNIKWIEVQNIGHVINS